MEKQIIIKRLPKSEVEILITIPWEEVKKTYEQVVEKASKELQLKGFRKGKAPKELIEENLNKTKIYSEVVRQLIPKYYEEALRNNNLRPIVNPKISLESAKQNSDWEVKILICEKPEVKLGNYKEDVSKLSKASRIWLPGEKSPDAQKEKSKDEKVQKIINWLLENIKIELSDLVVEEEVNRRLSELIDKTGKLGLTVEQYLTSTGKTADSLKEEYKKQAQEIWQIELILNQVADQQNIVVENEEIDNLVQKASSEEERKALESQRYLLASVIRRQKTLDFLANL